MIQVYQSKYLIVNIVGSDQGILMWTLFYFFSDFSKFWSTSATYISKAGKDGFLETILILICPCMQHLDILTLKLSWSLRRKEDMPLLYSADMPQEMEDVYDLFHIMIGHLSNFLSHVFDRFLPNHSFTSAFLIPHCFVYGETGGSEGKRH